MTKEEIERMKEIGKIQLKHPLTKFLQEIGLPGNYRFRVIVAGATLELFISTLVKHHCKKHGAKFAEWPFERKIYLLHDMGILSDNRFRLLNQFRDLRNDAAHEAKFEITKATIAKFPVTLVKPENVPEDDIIFHICGKMAFDLWNEHGDVLVRYFFSEQELNQSKTES